MVLIDERYWHIQLLANSNLPWPCALYQALYPWPLASLCLAGSGSTSLHAKPNATNLTYMPSFTDTDPEDHLSDPEEHSDDDSDDSDDGSEVSSDSGRGASHSFTSPSTVNDTSTRTSGSPAMEAAVPALQLGQQEEEADEDTSINDAAMSMPMSMSQHSANHPQRLFQSQEDDDGSAAGRQAPQQQAPAPAGESHPLPLQQSANTSSDMNDDDNNEDGEDEDETTGAPLGSEGSGEVLTAPDHDGPPAFGPNGTIVRNHNKKNEGNVVLTAPDDDHDPERVGPTGTIVRQPRGAGSQKHPAVEAEAAAGTDGDDESGDDDDDESSSDDEDDDGTLNSHEKERARILRVTHNELTNMVRALFSGAYIYIYIYRCFTNQI